MSLEKINQLAKKIGENPSNENLLALKIEIDKHLWKELKSKEPSRQDGMKLYDPLEEIKPETSVKMLSTKMEFWKYKHPDLEIVFDPEKKCILAGRWEQ